MMIPDPTMTTTVTTMTNDMCFCKKPFKMRHELKYNINHSESIILSSRLSKLFGHDEHADSRGIYRVSSLYFDTPYDKALKDKLDGILKREKFRIRYYNNDKAFIRLEKKMKTNGLCAKHSTELTENQVNSIIDGNYNFLRESQEPLLIEFYSKLQGHLLRPKTIVVYDREAFLYPPGNTRITIDRNLSTYTSCSSFLDLPDIKVNMSQGISVLEVKYDRFLPEIVQMAIQDPGRSTTAYSKYAISRSYD